MMEISVEDLITNQTSKSFKSHYKKICPLGKGAFGKVYKAEEIKTGNIVAVKQISLFNSGLPRKNIIKEISLLKNLNHPNIVKYYNYFEDEHHIYIIMEYLDGDTLKQYINIKQNKKEKITENDARIIITQLLNALSYLHYSCDICHRDVKPNNIVFKTINDINSLKLIDFGLSSDSFEKKDYLENCGTLKYMAPEQISNITYSKGVDIWSVGIILYMLLNGGKNPFYKIGDKREIIIKKITKGDINFNKEYPISEMGKHLIKKLLNKNQAHRYMARQALKHPWITLNKYDKIPLTVHEKLLVEEYNNKFKYFCLSMLFIMYYKKKYFIENNNNIKLNKFIDIKNILSKNISSNNSYLPSKRKFIFEIKKDNPEKFPKFLINNIDNENNKNYVLTDNKEEDLINNDNSVNLEEYEQKVIESNIYYENKFIEYRDNTFLPEYSNTNENSNNKLLDIKSKNMNNLIKNINYEVKNDFIFKKSTFTKSSRNIIGDMKNEESKIDSNLNEFTTTLKNYNNDSTPQKLGKNNKNITKPENIFKDLINSKNNNFNIACLSSKKLAKIFKMSNIKLHNSSSKILIKSKEKSKIDSKNNSLVNLDSLKIKNNLIKNFMAVNKSNDDILKKNFTSNKNLHKIGNEKLLPYFEDKKKLSDIKKTNLFKSCIIKNDINNYLKKQKSSVNEEDMDIKRKNANFLSSSKSKPILRNICVNLSKLNRNNNTISNNNIIELLKKLKQTPIKKNNNADIFPKILK